MRTIKQSPIDVFPRWMLAGLGSGPLLEDVCLEWQWLGKQQEMLLCAVNYYLCCAEIGGMPHNNCWTISHIRFVFCSKLCPFRTIMIKKS